MASQEWKCSNCRVMVKTATPFMPDRRLGGDCPKGEGGKHLWVRL